MIRTVWGQCPFDEETVPGGPCFEKMSGKPQTLVVFIGDARPYLCVLIYIYVPCNHMDVSQNGGTPKWMVYNGPSY